MTPLRTLHVRSCCKINLSLDVLARRADGYHTLQSVVHAVGLCDELEFDFGAPSLAFSCDVPALQTPANLVLRAAQMWLDAVPQAPEGCRIVLRKRVPSGAGLGGGSSNAAATLLAFNRAWGEPLDAVTLEGLGASLGADVPLFLRGGTLLLEGVGERLRPLPALRGWTVIVQPAVTLSTPQVFRRFDEQHATAPLATPALLDALQLPDETTRLHEVAARLGNDLSGAAHSLGAPVDELCAALRDAGALGASMTGSGSACFGLFAHEAAARAAAKLLHAEAAANFVAAAPLHAAGAEFSGNTEI